MADDLAKATGSTADVPDLSGVPKDITKMYQFAESQPDYQEAAKRLKTERATMETEQGRLAGLFQERQKLAGQAPVPDTSNVPAVKDLAEYSTASAPMFMIMSVVGGIIGRKNALAAIQTQSAMVDAMNQGQMLKFQQAKAKHDEAVDNIDREFKIRQAVYDQQMKLLEGQIDASRTAAEMAGNAVGADQKLMGEMKGNALKAYEGILKAKNSGAGSRLEGIAFKGLEKEAGEIRGAADAATKYKQRVDAVVSAWSELREAMKKDPSLAAQIDSAALDQEGGGLSKLNNLNPAIAKFTTAAARLAPAAMREINQGLSAGAIRAAGVKFANMEINSLPSLKGGVNTAQAAIDEIIKDAQGIYSDVQQKQQSLQKRTEDVVKGRYASAIYGGAPMGGAAPAGSGEVDFSSLP